MPGDYFPHHTTVEEAIKSMGSYEGRRGRRTYTIRKDKKGIFCAEVKDSTSFSSLRNRELKELLVGVLEKLGGLNGEV